jgi:hypothetical protein
MPSEKIYLGKIVDNKDPLYKGRAKIDVFGFFDDIPVEDLPWAEQIAGLSFDGNFGGGNISIPRIGTVVAVHFEENNYYKLTYHYIKEISPTLLDELRGENSYEGTQSLIYDTDAQPGTLKMIYTRQKGLVFQLGDATIQFDTQNESTDKEKLRIVIKLNDDEIRMEKDGSDQKVIVNSKNIELGESSTIQLEKLIKGETFQTFFDRHTHPTGVGPSGFPVEPMSSRPDLLSDVSRTI